ncbi:hypothetical protein ABK040_008823 [Willaertia magna]
MISTSAEDDVIIGDDELSPPMFKPTKRLHHQNHLSITPSVESITDITVADSDEEKELINEEKSVAELLSENCNTKTGTSTTEEVIDGDNIVDGEEEEEEVQPEAPKAIKENMDKLHELLAKTEKFSQVIHEHVLGNLEVEEDEEASSGKRKRKKGSTDDESAQKKLKEVLGQTSNLQSAKEVKLKYPQPKLLSGATLRDYQLQGVNWLISLYENGVNGILADEMGLGKTVQTIGLFCHLYEKGVKGPFLVVAPLSTLSNWINEIDRFAPELGCVLYHGNKDERSIIRAKKFPQVKKKHISVVVTSYEIAMRDKKYLANKFNWKYIVVDEAHRLKNFNCRLTRELKKYESENRLLLTGTPLQNNLSELWSLLNFLLPSLFDDLQAFNKWFNFAKGSNSYVNNEKTQLVGKLHNILRPFLLRRLKVDVDIEIPSKKEYLVFTPMTKMQKEYYDAVKNKDLLPIFKNSEKANSTKLLNILMQLRKICNHPYLIKEFEQKSNESDEKANQRFKKECEENCGKFKLLVRMLENLKKNGHKVLIFSLMTRFLDVLEDYLEVRGDMQYCRIDGAVAQTDREQEIKDFNNNPDVFCFLLSTRAGGLGINLTAADTVIIYDSDWNPQIDLQAQDRCHRIGQTRSVRIFRLLTTNSIEKKVLVTATKKLKLERLIIHKGNFKGQHTDNKLTITTKNLLEILSDETNIDESKHEGGINDENLDRLLNVRGEDSGIPTSGEGFEEANIFEEGFSSMLE